MATIRNFEELSTWQKARELAGYIYDITRKSKFSRDFGVYNQIRETSGVMPNTAEGFEAGYDAGFIRFRKMARRSAAEVQSEPYLPLDAGFTTTEELRKADDIEVDAKKLINGMISYLNKK